MEPYTININFVLTGKAQERLAGQTIRLPSPPPGMNTGFYPAAGDILDVPGLEAYTLVVVARKLSFKAGGLDVECYVETIVPDEPNLQLVK